MSEEKLDQLHSMVEQLIKMVGSNNAVTEEVRQRMDTLDNRMDSLDNRMDKMETKFDTLEANMATGFTTLNEKLEQYGQVQQQDVYHLLELLDTKLDKPATKEDVSRIENILDVLAVRTTRQEAEILEFKKKA